MSRITFLAPVAIVIALLAGCAAPTAYESTPAYSKYTLEQVIQWSKEGLPADQIVSRLNAANSFYPLTARELISLRDQGVSLDVLDYLVDSYVGTVRHEERFQLNRRFSASP